jgi:hypothetical protein
MNDIQSLSHTLWDCKYHSEIKFAVGSRQIAKSIDGSGLKAHFRGSAIGYTRDGRRPYTRVITSREKSRKSFTLSSIMS